MNKTVAEAQAFVQQILPGLQAVTGVEKVICPPFPSLPAIAGILKGTDVGLGAQNMYFEEKGAFTGEVSPAMVKEWCAYVILGHSERRGIFGETDETVAKKIRAALAVGLIPIVCVGETLSDAVCRRQTNAALSGLTADQAAKVVIAYEPIWAIGTGRAARGPDANKVVAGSIRPVLADLFGKDLAQGTRVLYGGSVTPANIAEFMAEPDLDGGLVGGASLKPDFVELAKAAQKRLG
jgi:triosephosphate isomerase